ncbi:malonate decarboxylase holo-[acyl-carrier-protein] synthase [Rhizobacter sp. Root1221]|uniref:malonate decarboxylase holo-[acyl-carrier-protein] synthase n=1 Tax=Rhizobacter sp. Root1221 TaxID=1736433 RepID=UPI0006F3CDF9|nr:malonate decarboxylase holo-[acyl-carrier-protein] synthase [Rhizobacter sp. Root1221]KQV96949.1 ACP synthase [Rhizobacter sp. Root1221]
MRRLHRHQLAWLSEPGWAAVLGRPWDPEALACLHHWSAHRLPLVVTRQPHDAEPSGLIALGLPCPARWSRRRLSLEAPRSGIACLGAFPGLAAVQAMVPLSARPALRHLVADLDACQAAPRVFGSYGWQAISGLDHVRPESDLDLVVDVDGPVHADAVARALGRFSAGWLRLDGELVFEGGAAVAWREWMAWRAGSAQAVMVKTLRGVSLQRDGAAFDRDLTESFP